MTADAASPDTSPVREELTLRALNIAGAAAEQAGLRGEFLVLAVAIPALIDAGLLSLSGDSTQTADGEGSLRSRASGTPSETIAEALRGYRLNLGPNTVDSIKQGMTRLDLTGSERRDIGLIAAKALGLEES